MTTERRYIPYDDTDPGPEGRPIELRVASNDDGEPTRIQGYVALYNRWSPVYGRFRERIAPGFFDEALSRKADIRLLFNHNPDYLLGRTRSGTLTLRSDEVGLWAEAPVPTGEFLRGLVVEPMKRRDLSGASFSFTLPPEGGQEWRKAEDGVWERTLTQAGEVLDVGPVTFPFYPETEVGVRAEVRSQLQSAFDAFAAAHPELVEPPAEPETKATDWDLIRKRTELAGM